MLSEVNGVAVAARLQRFAEQGLSAAEGMRRREEAFWWGLQRRAEDDVRSNPDLHLESKNWGQEIRAMIHRLD